MTTALSPAEVSRELSTNLERGVIKRQEIVHYKAARFWRDCGFKGSFVVRQSPIYRRVVRRIDPDFAKIQLDTKPVRIGARTRVRARTRVAVLRDRQARLLSSVHYLSQLEWMFP